MRRETLKLEHRPGVVRFLFCRLDVERHPVVVILRDGGLRRDDNSDLETLTS